MWYEVDVFLLRNATKGSLSCVGGTKLAVMKLDDLRKITL